MASPPSLLATPARALDASVVLRIEPDGALLYDRRVQAYHSLGLHEAFLLAASAEVGVGQAFALLAQEHGDQAAALAWHAIERRGVLGSTGVFAGRIVDLQGVQGAKAAPLVCHVGVTLACNFSCNHCYSSSGKRAANELSFAELRDLITQLAAMGCMKLVLGGGEPFVRKDLAAIIRCADAHGVDTFVHTNASLLSERALRELSRCQPAQLTVSVDGGEASVNDSIRGEGAFVRTARGLQLLREHYARPFNISATLSAGNGQAEHIELLIRFAADAGARTLLLRPTYPAGQAAEACSREHFSAAIEAARPLAQRLGLALDAPHPNEGSQADLEGFGCVAARRVLGVTPTGQVTPCLNLPAQFIAGNVREAPLLALWQRGSAFTALRDVQPNPQCRSCKHYDACRGGCRVRALDVHGAIDAPDAWCHYEPRDPHAPVAPPRRASPLNVLQQ